jgi:hypothetical protein
MPMFGGDRRRGKRLWEGHSQAEPGNENNPALTQANPGEEILMSDKF